MDKYIPLKPLKRCAYGGCTEYVRGERYCPAHKTIVNRSYDRANRNPKHYDHRWRKIRNLYIAKNPLCEDCLERGFYVTADEVHHKTPLTEGGTHAEDNLRSLCQSCHSKTRYSD